MRNDILFKDVGSDKSMIRHEFRIVDNHLVFDDKKLKIIHEDSDLDMFFLDNDFCLYRCHNNVWNLVDLNRQYLSGVEKNEEQYYFDFPGVFTKPGFVYFRIAKNGSSTMSALFGNKEGKWLNRDLGEDCKYIHLSNMSDEDVKKLNECQALRFCILREPMSRLLSSTSHFIRLPHPFFNSKWMISKSKFQAAEYFCRIMLILKKWHFCNMPGSKVDEMSHIIPQSLLIKKFLQRGLVIDKFVDLKDLKKFIESEFKTDFNEFNGGGKNNGKLSLDAFKYVKEMVKDALQDEYDFYESHINWQA